MIDLRVPVKSERDAFRITVGAAALMGAAVALGAAAGPLYGAALVLVAAIGVIAWGLLTKDADRRRPLDEAARAAPRVQDGRWRILVIANETLRGAELLAAIAKPGRPRPIIRVVAPVLPSRAHYFASDIDRELTEAGARLRDALSWVAGIGFEVTGRVHGDTPITAIEDELRSFAADELIISTHPPARSRWLESGLLVRVREELEIPVTHVVVDLTRQDLDVEAAAASR